MIDETAETSDEDIEVEGASQDDAAPQEAAEDTGVAEGAGAAEGQNPDESAEEQETSQRRRECRDPDATGAVTIDGNSFPLKDWSSSGFGIISCKLEFEPNARVPIDFNVTHSQGTLAFSCKAVIVRSDPDSGEVAGAFVEMTREDRVAVAAFFETLEE